MYDEYTDSNYGDYDLSLIMTKKYLEEFIHDMTHKGYYNAGRKKDYLDLFLGLQEEITNFEEKEAVEYFIDDLRG